MRRTVIPAKAGIQARASGALLEAEALDARLRGHDAR